MMLSLNPINSALTNPIDVNPLLGSTEYDADDDMSVKKMQENDDDLSMTEEETSCSSFDLFSTPEDDIWASSNRKMEIFDLSQESKKYCCPRTGATYGSRLKTSSSRCEVSSTSPKKTVRFGGVQVREYPWILGDNPSCNCNGPSLSIDWIYRPYPPVRVDDFESMRSGSRTERDLAETLVVPPVMRLRRAIQMGYTIQELVTHRQSIRAVQRQRARTLSEVKQQARSREALPFWGTTQVEG